MQARIIVGIVAAALIAAATVAVSEETWEDEEGGGQTFAAPANPQYSAECGSCHMAYPPGLLPARSWQKLMGTLSDHFGENAELAPDVAKPLTAYLVANAADRAATPRSARIAHSLRADQTPLRITQLPFFTREHRRIPASAGTGNPKVKSLSNCNACHARAAAGSFSEHDIRVPGFRGRAD